MGGRGRGGRNRARTQRKHFKENRENVWKRSKHDSSDSNTNSGWEPFATQNPAFEEYYKGQGIVSPEEWEAFDSVIRKPLPAAFRVNSSSQFCADIISQLENDFMKSLQTEAIDGVEVEGIRPLPWYPENLAWQSNYSRMQLRKNQTLERFHEFLKQENEIGNITRQEAVSMVPPLFLDVSPDHFVLDMCAAPGSKTFQLLEIIHRSTKPGTLPGGMVVANDVDTQRCNLLIHQTKRMCTANLIVTNHEAQHFPGCRLNKISSDSSEIGISKEQSMSQLMFDRVLCDVPCSGDGTLRKAPDIWRKWNVGMGNGIHCLQVQIAMRGLSLLKVGGRMVYSTCSMNPVENEAVVAEILRRCGGSVELVDVSCELPQLVRRPGLKKWKVRDKGMWLASYKDVPKFRRAGIVPSMFPSGQSAIDTADDEQDIGLGQKPENGGDINSENGIQPPENTEAPEEPSHHPLERCIRIVPHDQNTGAFFIAVLHKLSPTPAIQEKPVNLARNMCSNNEKGCEQLSNEVIASPNVNQEDDTDEKFPEAASDTDLVQNEPDEAASEHDPCQPCEENKPEEVPGDKKNDESKAGGKRKLPIQGSRWKGVDPVVFFKDETTINSIKTFYGIDDSFVLNGQLVTRNSDSKHVKRIYYISRSVKDVLELNLLVGQQLKITSVGLKMFERQTSREGTSTSCSFRISSEGLSLLLPYITKQILCASPVDFKHLLQYKTIRYADFVDAEFGEKASKLMLGCCVVILNKGTQSTVDSVQMDASSIAIGCWKGRASLTVMVTVIECQEMLERLLIRLEGVNGTSGQENVPTDVANEVEVEDPNDVLEMDEPETLKMATAD